MQIQHFTRAIEMDTLGQSFGVGVQSVDIQVSGFLGFLVLVADIWAILNIVQSSASMGKKLVWILIVLFLPLIGLIIWWFAGPRGR